MPEEPTSAMCCPAVTRSPAATWMPCSQECAYAVATVAPSMVCSMTTSPPYPPENSATVTVPSAAARIGVPSGAAKSLPVWNDSCSPVIGCTRGPKPLVAVQVPSGSGNTTRADSTARTTGAAADVAVLPEPVLPVPGVLVRAVMICSATGS